MRIKETLVISIMLMATNLGDRKKLESLNHVAKNFGLDALEYQKAIKDALSFYEEFTGEKVNNLCPQLKSCENAKVIDTEIEEEEYMDFFNRVGMSEPRIILELNIEKLEILGEVHKKYKSESGKKWMNFEEIFKSCLSNQDVNYFIGHYLYLMDKMKGEKPSDKTLEYLMDAKDYNPIPPRGSGEKFHPLKVLGHALYDLGDKRCLFYYKKSVEYNEYSTDIEYIGVLNNIIKTIEKYI